MKQIPSRAERGLRSHLTRDPDDYGMHYEETNTDYLNKHAEEYTPPAGRVHLHLIYAHTVHWRVVGQASSVCKIPGRCKKAFIGETPALLELLKERERQRGVWGDEHDDGHTSQDWYRFLRQRLDDFYSDHDDMTGERRRELMVHLGALALAAIEADDRGGLAMS